MGRHTLSDFLSVITRRLTELKHPILTILLVGLLLRLLVLSLSITYDSDYWTVVIRNIEAGAGLYEMEGYYYTPIWGYILGLVGAFQNLLLDMGESAIRVVESIFVEGLGMYVTATIPSILVLFSVKLPLYLSDVILAFLVMILVKEFTGDQRKASLAFALTFLSPVILISSGIIAMPDTIAASMTMLTILLLKRNHSFLAGLMFALAVLVKFFPAFLIFVFVAYLVANNRENRKVATLHVVKAIVGALFAVAIILLPPFMEGNLAQCFQFLSDRTGFAGGDGVFDLVTGILRVLVYGLVLLASAYSGYVMFKNQDVDPFQMLMKSCLIVTTLVLVYPPTTQYMVIMIPFLAYYIATMDRSFMFSWNVLGLGAIIYSTSTFALTLMPLAVWAGIGNVEVLMDIFCAWNNPIIGPLSMQNLQFAIGGVIQCVGVFLVLWGLYGDRVRSYSRLRRLSISG